MAYTIATKAIRFRIRTIIRIGLNSSSMSRHLSTRNISSKSMHAFLSNLANRQTDRQTNAGKRIYGGKNSFVPNTTKRRLMSQKIVQFVIISSKIYYSAFGSREIFHVLVDKFSCLTRHQTTFCIVLSVLYRCKLRRCQTKK